MTWSDVWCGVLCVVWCSAGAVQVQCSAVQCSAVQCSAVQCSAVQCSAVQCSAVLCDVVQCGVLFGVVSCLHITSQFYPCVLHALPHTDH